MSKRSHSDLILYSKRIYLDLKRIYQKINYKKTLFLQNSFFAYFCKILALTAFKTTQNYSAFFTGVEKQIIHVLKNMKKRIQSEF